VNNYVIGNNVKVQNNVSLFTGVVLEDDVFCGHPTPAMYGFQSYISVPIVLPGKRFFGTLCAIDPKPRMLRTPEVIGMFKLFAELIAFHLDANTRLATSAATLSRSAMICAIRSWRSRPERR
jgi:GAF domain-containing protein